jgi:tetratricopeptide (TPR) repeat protein
MLLNAGGTSTTRPAAATSQPARFHAMHARSIERMIAVLSKQIGETGNAPRRGWLLVERAECYGRGGRFPEALADYRSAIELDPVDHWRWFMAACLLAYLDDARGHGKHCEQMLQRFGESADPYICDRVAKSTLLLPPLSQARLERLDAVLDRALTHPPGDAEAWLHAAKVMADYRAGRFDVAATRAARWRQAIPSPHGQAMTEAYRAMAQQRLGRRGEAAAALASAIALADAGSSTPVAPGDRGQMFQDWLIYMVARREAERLLSHPTTRRVETHR